MDDKQRHRQLRSTIILRELPMAVHKFLEKNQDYGVGSDEFGPIAQVMDMSRKYKKIKAAIADGEELTGESLYEVAQDMLGHCLLLLEQLCPEADKTGGGIDFTAAEWRKAYSDAVVQLAEGSEVNMHWFLEPPGGIEFTNQEHLCRTCGLTFADGFHWEISDG